MLGLHSCLNFTQARQDIDIQSLGGFDFLNMYVSRGFESNGVEMSQEKSIEKRFRKTKRQLSC
jgi:capsular polysaccharide biosynthesis protein